MADVFSQEQRSAVMRRVKGSNTKPELRVRRFLHGPGAFDDANYLRLVENAVEWAAAGGSD